MFYSLKQCMDFLQILRIYYGCVLVLGRVDGNSSYNSMGDNWGSHRFAQVKLEFLKTYIFSPSKADTSPKQ